MDLPLKLDPLLLVAGGVRKLAVCRFVRPAQRQGNNVVNVERAFDWLVA